jgi:2-iminobutanoate/2-iminopropanoate deaminase
MKRRIETDFAPRPIGPYSQAIEVDGWVWCAGQIGTDPQAGALVEGGAAVQAERALRNLGAVLDAAGASFADVVKTTVFLADMADFAAVNEVYAGFFPDPPPARSTFAVAALPRGARFEIEAVARPPSA